MASEDVLSYQVKLETDEASARRVVSSLEKTEEATARIRKELDSLGPSAKAGAMGVLGEFEDVSRKIDQQSAQLDELKAQYKDLDNVVVEPTVKLNAQEQFDQVSQRVALAGDFQSNLGALQGLSGLAGLGGLGQGVGAVGEIVVLIEELPRLKAAAAGIPAAFSAMTSALGVSGAGLIGGLGLAGIALAGASLAAQAFAASAEKSTKATEAYRAALEDALGLDSNDLQSKIEQRQREIAQAREAIAILEELKSDAPSQVEMMAEDTAGTLATLAAGLQLFATDMQDTSILDKISPILDPDRVSEIELSREAIDAQLIELRDGIGLASVDIEAYTRAQGSASVAAQDAAAAQTLYNETLMNDFQQGIAEALRIDQMSAEQRLKTMEANQREIDLLREMGAQYQENEAIQKEVRDRTAELILANLELGRVTESTADREIELTKARDQAKAALEANSEGAKQATQNYLDAVTAQAEAGKKLREIQQEEEKAIAQINAQLAEKEADARADAGEKLLEIEQKAEEDRAKIAERAAKRIQKIEEDYALARSNAIGDRDSRAADLALAEREKQLKEADESKKEETKDLESNLKDQREALDKSLREQLKAAQDAATQSIRTTQDRYANERSLQQQAQQQAFVAQQNALNAMDIMRTQAYSREQIAAVQHYNNMFANADFGLTALEQRFASFSSRIATVQLPGGGGGGGSSVMSIPFLGTPEFRTNNSAGINISIPINGAGMSRRQILDAVDSQLAETLRTVGLTR